MDKARSGGRGGGLLSRQLSLSFLQPGPGHLRIRLTPPGYGFFALVGCGFLLSINFSNNLLFAMTFMLVSIALVGLYQTWSNLKKLSCSDWRAEPVFSGQQAVYTITLTNQTKVERYGLYGHCAKASAVEAQLRKKEQKKFKLQRKTTKRGLLPSAPAEIRSRFPLGIFEARLGAGALPPCLVYPAPVMGQALPIPASNSDAHLFTESGSYRDMRRYSPGDPLSRISWKAFARFDELYTKEFDGAQGQSALWLRWDDLHAGGVEERLSQLCRWVLDAYQEKREFGLELPGEKIEPGGEEAHLQHCLKRLALYGNQEPKR